MVAASLAIRWSLSDIWNNSGFLEIASALSTLVLIIGAVVEEWPKLKQIGVLLAKLLLLRSTKFERCALGKLILHSIGALLVVAGIVGELVFETRTFIVEDRETTRLETEATNAKNAARDAGRFSIIAQNAAGGAELKADAVGRK